MRDQSLANLEEAKLEFTCPVEIQQMLVPAFAEYIRGTFRRGHVATESEPKPPGEYMTTDEVAAYIKRHPNTIRQWCRRNDFPYVVLAGQGRNRVFSKKLVDRWMEKRAVNVS